MKDNSKKHQRKSIRLSEYDYSFPNWYYITICTHERRNLFGKINNGEAILNEKGNVVEEEWVRTKKIRKNVDLDYYVIMPNHLHGIIIIEQSIENGRGELNSPTGNNSGRIQYAPTNNKFKSSSKTIEDVGATRRVAQNKEDRAIQRIAPTKQTLIPNSLGSIINNGRGELNSPTIDESGRMQYAPTNNKFKSPSQTLGAIVRGFKSSVTKRLREISGNSDLKIWQRNYYEHIIRNEVDLQNIRQYITLNPLKWEIDEYYNS